MSKATQRSNEHPRRIMMRASPQQAREQDSELKALQLSSRALDSAEAFALVKAPAISVPSSVASARDWEHADASFWLWATEASKEPCAYNEKKLLAAATIYVAVFEVSRIFSASSAEEHFFKVLIAANTQITGWRQGTQIGIISFPYEAAEGRRVAFDGTMAPDEGWGLFPQLRPSALFEI